MKKILRRDIRYFYFLIAVSFYLLFVVLFIFFMKNLAADYILRDIDRRLMIVARSIPITLPADYHDRAIKPGAINKNEWDIVEKKLTHLAEASGVQYAWTDVLIYDKVYMTSCNRTEQTEEEGLELYYFMPYPEGVSNEEFSAFQGMDPVFANFEDRWGRFRAVFIPYISPGGKKYLSCAEYTIDYVQEMLNKSKLGAFLIAILLFLAFLPVFLVYIVNAKAEARKLEESELNLRITLNSIGEGVIVTDANSNIVMINPTAEIITGWSAEESLKKSLDDVFQISIAKNYQNIRRSDKCGDNDENRDLNWIASLRAKRGEKTITHTSAPIRTGEGDITGYVIVFRDISEIVKLEEELRQSQKMESIGQLAGGIAHDFNNMLGAIMGSAELLRIHLTDNINIKENIYLIMRASEKASDMTHKLLAFSRKGEVKKAVIDIHKSIESVVCILSRSIDRSIDIQTSLEAERHFIVADTTLLENALLNLGINSRDAMEHGGMMSIKTKNVRLDRNSEVPQNFKTTPGEYIEVEFSDTGCGIPEDMRKKVFEPFFTTKEEGKGTGLGLSMIYGTVRNHDGMIRLESEVDKGTTFRLYFPVTYESGELHEKNLYNFKGSGTVLLVDDEDLILAAATNILRCMSYDVITASNGYDALELYQQNMKRVKIAIIDLIMPRMSGIDLFHELHRLNPDLQVIISSGFSNESAINELIRAGASGIIYKPYSASGLAEVMEKTEKMIRKK